MQQLGLAAVRYGLPLVLLVGGFVAVAFGGNTAGFGIVLIGSAFIVWLINALFRLSLVSNREREEEEHARDYYEHHGHWPDGSA
jgi:hypothetical protein